MKNDNYRELASAISNLEIKASNQKREVQDAFNEVTENFKPVNILKGGFKSVFSNENKEDLLNLAVGIGSGFLSKKLLFGTPKGFLGKNIGSAIQWGIAGLVSKNAERIKDTAGNLIDRYLKRKKSSSNHQPQEIIHPVHHVKN